MLGDDGAGENNAEPELVNFRILFLLASSSLSLHLSSCRLFVLRLFYGSSSLFLFVFALTVRLRLVAFSLCRPVFPSLFYCSSSLFLFVLMLVYRRLRFVFLTVVALHRLW